MASYDREKMVRLLEWSNAHFHMARRLMDRNESAGKLVRQSEELIRERASNVGALRRFEEIRRLPLQAKKELDVNGLVRCETPLRNGTRVVDNLGIDSFMWKTYLQRCEELESFRKRLESHGRDNEPQLRLVQRLREQVIAWGFRDPKEQAL